VFGALALARVAVLSCVVDCAFFVAYDPYDIAMAWTMLLLWPGRCGASMVYTLCLPMLVSVIHPCLLPRQIYGPLNLVTRYLQRTSPGIESLQAAPIQWK
jgi:hypothetical protein